jgi:simple sugar transport system permease protein
MVSMFILVVLWLFNVFILKTKLGQDFRTVGQSAVVAMLQELMSTKQIKQLLFHCAAAWGQIIFLQI